MPVFRYEVVIDYENRAIVEASNWIGAMHKGFEVMGIPKGRRDEVNVYVRRLKE